VSFSNLSLFLGRTGDTFIAAKQKDLGVGMNFLVPFTPFPPFRELILMELQF